MGISKEIVSKKFKTTTYHVVVEVFASRFQKVCSGLVASYENEAAFLENEEENAIELTPFEFKLIQKPALIGAQSTQRDLLETYIISDIEKFNGGTKI